VTRQAGRNRTVGYLSGEQLASVDPPVRHAPSRFDGQVDEEFVG